MTATEQYRQEMNRLFQPVADLQYQEVVDILLGEYKDMEAIYAYSMDGYDTNHNRDSIMIGCILPGDLQFPGGWGSSTSAKISRILGVAYTALQNMKLPPDMAYNDLTGNEGKLLYKNRAMSCKHAI